MERKSMKGQRNGQVGAPPKPVKLPRGNFTVEKAVELNPGVCELTVRKRILAAVNGFYYTGTGKDKRKVKVEKTLKITGKVPQPDGNVGRPSFKFGPLDAKTDAEKSAARKATKKPAAKKLTKAPTSTPVATVTANPEPASAPTVTPSAVVTPEQTPEVTPTATA